MKSPSLGSMLRTGRPATSAGSPSGSSTRNHCRIPGEEASDAPALKGVSTTMHRTPSRASRRLCQFCSSMVFMAYLDLLYSGCQIALLCAAVNSERHQFQAHKYCITAIFDRDFV